MKKFIRLLCKFIKSAWFDVLLGFVFFFLLFDHVFTNSLIYVFDNDQISIGFYMAFAFYFTFKGIIPLCDSLVNYIFHRKSSVEADDNK